MSQRTNGRLGKNFVLRLTDDERRALERMCAATAGPRALGPWLVWAASQAFDPPPVLPRRALPPRSRRTAARAQNARSAMPELVETSRNLRKLSLRAMPTPAASSAESDDLESAAMPPRLILDLCGGTGAWSDPYRLAGYDVRVVDVRSLEPVDVCEMAIPSDPVHGILCAPPCTEFSLAKNGSKRPRDIRKGLEVVSACLRLVVACRPVWWALENPVGLLSKYLGSPRDTWEPYEFGDPHTKLTAVWGDYELPRRGPFVEPTGSAMDRSSAEERAITPSGFARAFFEANP